MGRLRLRQTGICVRCCLRRGTPSSPWTPRATATASQKTTIVLSTSTTSRMRRPARTTSRSGRSSGRPSSTTAVRLDYLAARGDIDMERIGLLGYSMGGFHAFAVTATEPRIKLAVACVVPTVWSHDLVLAPANYVRGIGGRHFCMLMGRDDEMCNESQARELYALIEGANTKLVLYDAGHTLPVKFVTDAVAFVAARL